MPQRSKNERIVVSSHHHLFVRFPNQARYRAFVLSQRLSTTGNAITAHPLVHRQEQNEYIIIQ
jgi:hypothetical protein